MSVHTWTHEDHAGIEQLLVGRRIVKAENFDRYGDGPDFKLPRNNAFDNAASGKLTLDDGTELLLAGNEGCGGCYSGWYDLTEVATTDNVITSVDFEDNPHVAGYPSDGDDASGSYSIFVYADNKRINAARFEGDDGNEYYGTGYRIHIIDEPVVKP